MNTPDAPQDQLPPRPSDVRQGALSKASPSDLSKVARRKIEPEPGGGLRKAEKSRGSNNQLSSSSPVPGHGGLSGRFWGLRLV
jgi:hypothetical protein